MIELEPHIPEMISLRDAMLYKKGKWQENTYSVIPFIQISKTSNNTLFRNTNVKWRGASEGGHTGTSTRTHNAYFLNWLEIPGYLRCYCSFYRIQRSLILLAASWYSAMKICHMKTGRMSTCSLFQRDRIAGQYQDVGAEICFLVTSGCWRVQFRTAQRIGIKMRGRQSTHKWLSCEDQCATHPLCWVTKDAHA